jgi:hypothetical protein
MTAPGMAGFAFDPMPAPDVRAASSSAEPATAGAKSAPSQPATAAGPGLGVESEVDRRVSLKLKTRIPKLDFTNLDLSNVVQFFRDASGAEFHVNWAAVQPGGVDWKMQVNLHMVDVTVEKALKKVLQDLSTQVKLAYQIVDGVVMISTSDELAKTPITRTYDVRDLLATHDADNRSGLGQQIVDLIKESIDKDSWAPGGKTGTIRHSDGMIQVTQTAENHKKLAARLEQLREVWMLQTKVCVVFIHVNAHGRKTLRDWLTARGIQVFNEKGDGRIAS